MNYAAVLSDTTSTRVRYLLREYLDPLPPRRVVPVIPTSANSGTPWVGPLDLKLVSNESPETNIPGTDNPDQGAHERLVDIEAATTASDVTFEVTTSATDRAITRALSSLLAVAREERFEDGVDSNLSVGLRVLFRNHSTEFVRVLEDQLDKRAPSVRILTEVLHTLGDIEDYATRDWRFATLVRFLRSSSPLIRDAAAIGLSYLDDKRAAPFLRAAIERESSKEFREDLRAITEQLGT